MKNKQIKVSYISNEINSDIKYLINYKKEDLLEGLNFIELNKKEESLKIINYLKENKIFDIFIMTSNLTLLKEMSNIYNEVRYVYETTNKDELINIKKTLFNNNIFTCLIPLKYLSQKLVRNLHLEGVKIITRVSNNQTIYEAILNGVDGVLGKNLKKVDINANLTMLPFLTFHRGLHKYYNENTIDAGIEAAKYGADFLEMDVHVTKDNKVVVNHDYDLIKFYNKEYVIKEEDYQTLKKARLKKEFKTTNNYLPLLSDFDKMIDKDVHFLIEVKTKTKDEAIVVGKEFNKLKRGFQVFSFFEETFITLNEEVKNNKNGIIINYKKTNRSFEEMLKLVNKYNLTVNPYYLYDNLEYREGFLKRMIEYTPWGVLKIFLRKALNEGFTKLNSDYGHTLHKKPKLVTAKQKLYYRLGTKEDLILKDDKGNNLKYKVNYLNNDNNLGLKINKNQIVSANKFGVTYIYLTHSFRYKFKKFKLASNLITVEVI